jgi:hypothetical protein
MKVFRVAALAVLVSGPAYAQMPNINLMPEDPTKTMEQVEQEKARDKAYKDTLRAMPDAKASSDPWGGVRSDAKSAPAKSTTAPKAKAKSDTKTDAKADAKTARSDTKSDTKADKSQAQR